MKRQQLFNSFLPGVTVAVLTAQPAWAGSASVDVLEVDSYLDATNLNHSINVDRHEQVFAEKLYLQSHTPIAPGSRNWSTVKTRSTNTKTKTILSRVPKIRQVSVQRGIRSSVNNDLSLVSQPPAMEDLGKNISYTKAKGNKVGTIDNYKPMSWNISTSESAVPITSWKSKSKPKFFQPGIKEGEIKDRKPANSKQGSQRDSPSALNVSQETVTLASSLPTNNCRASALLSNSGKCNNRFNVSGNQISTKQIITSQKVINSGAVSAFLPGEPGGQNQAKVPNPSLANKLQRLKRVADRKSTLELSNIEFSSKTQLAQTNPQQTTPPTTQPPLQQTTPPTTQPNSQDATPPVTRPQVDPDAPPPDYLNPNPNPLVFPSKPEEAELQGTQPITLGQALELARRNNRELQQSLLELKRQQAAVRQQQAALFPTLGLTTNVTRSQSSSGQLQNELQPRPDGDEPNTNFDGRVELNYDLYTSGRRLALIRREEERLKFNELNVERLSEQIRLNVFTDYYNLQEADESVRIQRSAVRNGQASLRDAEAQERAGIGTRFAVLQSRSNLATNIQNLNNAIANQIARRSQLAQRLSLPQSVGVAAADPVKLAGLWDKSLEESMALAFQNRPELQQQLAQRNISEQDRRAALAALGPQIRLVGRYEFLDQFDDGVGVTDGYSLGLQASLNLFDGGAARASADQQEANIAIAENTFAQTRESIRSEVEQAFAQLESNLRNVETANLGLEEAREALRLARLRFQAGVGTQTDVINQEDALTRAEGARITAILGYNRALATLQRAITSRGLTASDNPNPDGQGNR